MHPHPEGRVQLSDPAEKDCHYIQYWVHPVHTTLFLPDPFVCSQRRILGAACPMGLIALYRCTRVPTSRHLYGSITYRQISVAGLTAFGYLVRDSTIGKNGFSARYAFVSLFKLFTQSYGSKLRSICSELKAFTLFSVSIQQNLTKKH